MTLPMPPALEDALTEPVVRRRWLLYLGYDPAVRLYSGDGEISWGGEIWGARPFTTSGPRYQSNGVSSLRIQFGNLDHFITAIVLGERGVNGIECRLYHYDDDAVNVFTGYLSGADIDERCTIHAVSWEAAYQSAPSLAVGPPVHNHVTPAGTTVVLGSARITINRR